MAAKTVFCAKLKKDLPGLEKPPFSGELGQMIFERVSADAWKEWTDDMMIKIINEYRLNLADAKQYDVLMKQLKAFLNLDGEEKVLEVENADRGKSS